MLSKPFEKPVRVWVGLGFPRQLNTVADAYQFAVEWCGNSPEQKAAIRACKAALVGDVDPETARGVFTAFARKKDILMEDVVTPPSLGRWTPSHV
ncbi:DUF982 domain-containing protein [Mesorhizobium sp. 113-3-3]|jgi:hypothetical protein|uniref:DUF982 domain-containing protein n=1 Tax=Mesorhizobium sp. 113-3-3 TaxID=2744516 RepID=UPI001925BEAB|nr:DUF982 domain-containing protein [Mesorhizobium sp. 113-3-3]BCG82497.1 hypothetical protein MesoLj113b_60390 [Mesorhizobium sp. 113-3-3]